MRFLVPLAIVLVSLNAFAQMYSWKDANGKVQYSDQPPPTATPVRKVAPPAAAVTDPDASRKRVAAELEMKKKQKDAKEAASKADQEKAAAAENRVNCERAQGSLRALESGQTRFTTDAQGNRVALDGELRDAELATARKNVDSWCK